jgi:hypothetical protein
MSISAIDTRASSATGGRDRAVVAGEAAGDEADGDEADGDEAAGDALTSWPDGS